MELSRRASVQVATGYGRKAPKTYMRKFWVSGIRQSKVVPSIKKEKKRNSVHQKCANTYTPIMQPEPKNTNMPENKRH